MRIVAGSLTSSAASVWSAFTTAGRGADGVTSFAIAGAAAVAFRSTSSRLAVCRRQNRSLASSCTSASVERPFMSADATASGCSGTIFQIRPRSLPWSSSYCCWR